ncbi:Fructosamine kinase domain-containing protein [Trichoderma austrokoningii]
MENHQLRDLMESSRASSSPYYGDFRVDDNVLACFPSGTVVLCANRFGTSSWTVTARLHLKLPDGSEEEYFLKSAPGVQGQIQMKGEFHAMSELYRWAPDLVPKPHSWGVYADEEPLAGFFLSQYIDMNDAMPDPNQLCAKLARLHRESQSPTGQFGFDFPTSQGRVPQHVAWESNWTIFFTHLLEHVIDLDFEWNGYWKELDQVEKQFIEHVIPRLLDALVKGGRTIKPCLIHADLWEGNSGTSPVDDSIHIFDAAAFYAHHEMDVGDWRCHYNKISNKVYTETYLQHHGPSEPEDEWEDRNRLYSVYYNMIYSVNYLGKGKAVRQQAYQDMYYLVDNYAPFPEGSGPRKLYEWEMTLLSAEQNHAAS